MFMSGFASYKGGVAADQADLQNSEADGFEFLKKRRKLALWVEHLVLRPTWVHLFTEADGLLAQQKLSGEHGQHRSESHQPADSPDVGKPNGPPPL